MTTLQGEDKMAKKANNFVLHLKNRQHKAYSVEEAVALAKETNLQI